MPMNGYIFSDRLKNNIQPSTLGLFDLIAEERDGKNILKVVVSSGIEKPYYLRKYGMSPKGCFIRVGGGVQPMTPQMIDRMYAKRNRITLVNIESPRQELSFNQLKIYYEEKGLMLNDQFKKNLDLLTSTGTYNYNAYLLADDNGVSIKVAKYAGTNKIDLIENEEYGYCCLIKAANRVLDKLTVENKTFAKITPRTRLERKMIDAVALREAFINAVVHNDYSREVPPLVEIYSDRLTITSYGGLVDGLSNEDFFDCISMPRNRELMRVFKDVGMVEQLGSGMSRILNVYNESIFTFTPNFMIVTFRFAEDYDVPVNVPVKNTANGILEILAGDSAITYEEIANKLSLTRKTIQRHIQDLKNSGLIRRIGSDKTGHWEVIKKGAANRQPQGK
jgi:predicted HTH transcriptional regulator